MALAMKDKFTAAPAALGYLHQCRYALLLLLERMQDDLDAQIAVERFDDVSFEKQGSPEQLIQIKHHLGTAPNLSDTSSDMWTTLRAWSHSVATGVAVLPSTMFTIVTTATCAPDSAAYYLRPGDTRDFAAAHKLLLDAAKRMKGETLKPARDAFAALGPAKQRLLLEATQVLDQSPVIADVPARIQKALGFPVAKARLATFTERLEGWWFSQVIDRMVGDIKTPITATSLELAIADLQEGFRADSLPIDFRNVSPPLTAVEDHRVYIRQLRLIDLDSKNINWARVDFYRAFSQRSRWLKDDLVNLTQLDEYDGTLREEWERQRDWIDVELDAKSDEAKALTQRGQALYRHLQCNCRPIRPNCTEPYVGRGSYHLLAERKLVGWHRDYIIHLDGGVQGEELSRDDVE